MIDEAQKLNAAFDATGIKFNDRAQALASFKEGREIVYDESGEPCTRYDSEYLPLSDALTRFAYDRRDLVDGRTLPRQGAGSARPGTLSKADFTDVKSKVEFIREHGEDAYARLPLTGVGTSEVKTRQDFMKLPREEKVRRYAADPECFNKLPSAPTDQIKGSFINHAAIAKQQAIRPSSRKSS